MAQLFSKALLISLTFLAGLSSLAQTTDSTEIARAQLALTGPPVSLNLSRQQFNVKKLFERQQFEYQLLYVG